MKTIFFSWMKSPPKPNVYGDYSLKQHNTLECLGCYLDSNLLGESMACRVLAKINIKLNFLWRHSNYLNYSSRRFLCNALVQLPFEYGCTSWYPVLSKILKTKLQIAQNKCICFYLELPPRSHINASHFRKINWLLVWTQSRAMYFHYCFWNTGKQ